MSLLILYRLFLEGQTPSGIAKYLTKEKIPSPSGKELWQKSTVTSILHNEKYKGDAMLQKTFTVDFLTKKKKVNEGEIPQYYVENSHPAIISPEVFDLAQHEFRKRKNVKGYKTGGGCFSGKIICSECGSFFGSKVWHSTSKYRRVIWQCNHKFKNKEKCKTPHLYEDDLKAAFVKAFNSLIENLTDNQFWKWVSNWFSEDFIMDIINNWDIDTKEEEIKNLKEITDANNIP